MSLTAFETNGFAAIPVRNIDAVIRLAWAPTRVRNRPARCGSFVGVEPGASDNEFMIGAKIPPPLAVFEGTTGPRISSAPQSEYPSPSVVLPNQVTSLRATLFPNPVFITAPAMRKAATTNQTTESA